MASLAESQNQSDAPQPVTEQVAKLSFLTRAFGSGLFSGYSPIASGTFGSLVGLAVYFIPNFELTFVLLPACLIVFFFGVRVAGTMEGIYGHDPAEVTIDEILGMWVALLFLPKSLIIASLAFFIFRILDIIKPFPAKIFDSKKGGVGIMADDVVSGIYTNAILQILVGFRILG